MKEIVVLSGKGGTGKTSITAALGVVAGGQAVVADCDVDAANLHILYQPQNEQVHDFFSGKLAVIDYGTCSACGVCEEKCRFDAIQFEDSRYVIDEVNCEGCSVCSHLCPEKAITMIENKTGNWYQSKSRLNHWFVHARLGIAQENSGKLVSKVKHEAKRLAETENIPYVIVDGPPGVGCPVISAFSGTSHILIVTEATRSGLHDLKRLVELIDFFKAAASCVINKYDLNETITREIEAFCQAHGINVINRIPYDGIFTAALKNNQTLMETGDPMIVDKINEIWNHLKT
jgi:MinD superfamily P-loop ATPase